MVEIFLQGRALDRLGVVVHDFAMAPTSMHERVNRATISKGFIGGSANLPNLSPRKRGRRSPGLCRGGAPTARGRPRAEGRAIKGRHSRSTRWQLVCAFVVA